MFTPACQEVLSEQPKEKMTGGNWTFSSFPERQELADLYIRPGITACVIKPAATYVAATDLFRSPVAL